MNSNLMIPDFSHNIRIRLAKLIFFWCVLTLLWLCPVGCLSLEKLNWDSQQGRDLTRSGHNKQKFQLGQSYSYIMRKVCYHQIWIQNYLLRSHCVRPNTGTFSIAYSSFSSVILKRLFRTFQYERPCMKIESKAF